MFIFYYFFFGGQKQPQTVVNKDGQQMTVANHAINMKFGTPLDLYVYLSPNETSHSYSEDSLLLYEKNLIFGSWEDYNTRSRKVVLPMTENLLNNGSLYAHCYFTVPKKNPQKTKPLITLIW